LGVIADSLGAVIPVRVENRSDLPINIEDVAANCLGCIDYELDRTYLTPGQSSLLRLGLNPMLMRGKVQIFVAVVTGDPAEPQSTLEINAFVEPCYQVAGGPVAFAKVIQGYPRTWRLAVKPLIQLDYALDQVVSELPGFSGTVHYDESRQRYAVEIVAGAELTPGLHNTVVSLRSSAGDVPPCFLPVGATVQEPFLVVPDRLIVGPTSREQLRMIVLEHHLEQPLRVTGVALPGPNCRYKVYHEEDPSKTWLNIYFYDVNTYGAQGDVVIHTDHPAYPTIAVPVTTQDLAMVMVEPQCPQAAQATRGRTRTR
jgi:hypothetical protein